MSLGTGRCQEVLTGPGKASATLAPCGDREGSAESPSEQYPYFDASLLLSEEGHFASTI